MSTDFEIELIKYLFFLPPPQTKNIVFFSGSLKYLRAFEICDDVKSANVDIPSSKERPFAKDISKSYISNESL